MSNHGSTGKPKLELLDRDQQAVVKVDYYLSNAVPETPLWEFARVASRTPHRRMYPKKQERSRVADYEVRNWTGWQHHQTLSLLATWFLVRETARGKKMDPCDDLTAAPRVSR